ncbi:hypothetical protein EMGBS4_15310 [Acidimicrobiaceae bacterium]|nr:hypothetical protein EMGBS4_15310 [Acidimicrobiaceae bacterium]
MDTRGVRSIHLVYEYSRCRSLAEKSSTMRIGGVAHQSQLNRLASKVHLPKLAKHRRAQTNQHINCFGFKPQNSLQFVRQT